VPPLAEILTVREIGQIDFIEETELHEIADARAQRGTGQRTLRALFCHGIHHGRAAGLVAIEITEVLHGAVLRAIVDARKPDDAVLVLDIHDPVQLLGGFVSVDFLDFEQRLAERRTFDERLRVRGDRHDHYGDRYGRQDKSSDCAAAACGCEVTW